MLSDQDDDKRQNPLNPLRKAMRRRNVKKVEFAAGNSYHEPDQIQYSSEEEDEESGEHTSQEQGETEEEQRDQNSDRDQNVSAGRVGPADRNVNGSRAEPVRTDIDTRNIQEQNNGLDPTRTSDESSDRTGEFAACSLRRADTDSLDDGIGSKSRKGTPRNTDSFFKDESLETRKINLTPSLLREESHPGPQQPVESQEVSGPVYLISLTNEVADENKRKP